MGSDLVATVELVALAWFCVSGVVAALVALLFIGGRRREHGQPKKRTIRGESPAQEAPAEVVGTR